MIKTRRGRVVYERKRHYFGWKSAHRILMSIADPIDGEIYRSGETADMLCVKTFGRCLEAITTVMVHMAHANGGKIGDLIEVVNMFQSDIAAEINKRFPQIQSIDYLIELINKLLARLPFGDLLQIERKK